jgi:aryl-alcohol dehydrogenase-like predicted oxidoreductase
VPIFGAKRSEYVEDNLKALHVQLNREDLAQIDQAVPMGAAKGLRYPEASMQAVNR